MTNEKEFKETHLRNLYKILGHKGFISRVGSLDYTTKKYEQVFLKTEDQVIEYARTFNGTRNIFISRAYRNANGDPIGSWVITFDLDPIRPKDTASTIEQHNATLNAGRRILSRYPGGYLSSSGNGALLIYRLSSAITNLNEYYAKEKMLIAELQTLVDDLGIKIDATNYAEAIIKAIGTFSTKGEMSLRRCSRFIEAPIPPYRNSPKLLQRLNEIVPEKQMAIGPLDVKRVLSLFKGDRSEADFHLVNYIHRSGAGPEVALAALQANPLGRQNDEKDQARLISKIYGDISVLSSGGNEKNDYFTRLFSPKENNSANITTGFKSLDTALGSLPKGELSTFAARSGFGKTTFGCTLAEDWRKQRKKVLYFSTEMHKDYILHKLVSLSCQIPLARTIQKEFTESEITRIRAYEQELLRSPIIICDEFQPTIELVRNEMLKHNPDIVIFDHITQSGTHWETIAQFARALKELTKTENVATILLSMLSEPGRGKDGTTATSIRGDVRGSQEILYLSAIFCMFSNPYDVKGNFQPVDVLIAKNRYGISNQIVPLSVDKSISKYIERNLLHEQNVS